jgi:nucleoside-diphosphate-sugar epimerase
MIGGSTATSFRETTCRRGRLHRVGEGLGRRTESQFAAIKRIDSLGWRARFSTLEGIQHTYPWIEEQVRKARAGK